MADKNVTVRLRAVVDEYKRAMDSAAKSTDGVTKRGADFTKLGASASQLGGTLTRNVTLPLLAVGAAAGKMAFDFEGTFAKMQGLAGVSADEVDGLKDSVLDLAGETAQAPQALAEALYFIRSSGIDGAAAMEVLEVSAKGATAGLGEAAVVADLVTSALGAYGEANLTAAAAGDILAATAREGKVEASELAPQFGRLLPLAAELGVSMDQLGGGLAFLSRSGGGAALAGTNMIGVLSKMLEPGEEGAKALEAVGSSASDLRQSIRDKGLLATLQDLRTNLENNGLSFSDFSRDIQFSTGALALTSGAAGETEAVFDSLKDSTGDLGGAFGVMADTDGFKMKQAMADVQVALVKLGDVILPLAAAVAEFGAMALTALSSLPGPLDTVVLGFLAMAFAAGPLLKMAGPLVTAWKKLADIAGVLAPNTVGAAGGIGQLSRSFATGAAAIATGVYAIDRWNQGLSDARAKAEEWSATWRDDAFASQADGLDAFKAKLSDVNFEFAMMGDELASVQGAWGSGVFSAEKIEQLEVGQDKLGAISDEMSKVVDAAAALAIEMGISEEAAFESIIANDELATSASEAGDAFDTEAAAIIATTDALTAQADALHAMFDPVFAMQAALLGEAEAQAAVTEAIAEHGAGSEEAAKATRDLAAAVIDTDDATLGLKAAMADGTMTMEGARAELDRWVASGRLTKTQADEIAWSIGIAVGQADAFEGTSTRTLKVNTWEAWQALSALERKFATNNWLARFTGPSGAEEGGLVSSSGMAKPGPTDTVPVMLAPGEFVMSAATTRRMGVAALSAMNGGAVQAAPAPRVEMAGGGSTTVVHNHWTINASSLDERHMARTVRDAVEAGSRRGIAA